MTAYVHNIVSTYSAPTNGTSPIDTALVDAKAFVASTMGPADTLVLHFQNGAETGGSNTYDVNGNLEATFGSFMQGGAGGRTVTLDFHDDVRITGSFAIGMLVGATFEDATHSARLEANLINATTVILKTLSDYTRFSVGQWVCIGDTDIQGFGVPQNPRRYDHAKITDIDAITGVITLDRALTSAYLDTLPVFSAGGPGLDLGGPSTMWAFADTYDLDLTIDLGANVFICRNDEQLIYGKCRKLTVNGPTSSGFGGLGLCPTVSHEMYLNGPFNGDNVNACEIDKMIGVLHNDGTPWHRIWSQSGIGEGHFSNTPASGPVECMRKMYFEGGNTFAGIFRPGPVAYAWTEKLYITNDHGPNAIVGPLEIPAQSYPTSAWEWVGGGVFRAALGTLDASNPLLHPGCWLRFSGTGGSFGKPFNVNTVTFDGSYIYSHTNLAAFPTFDMAAYSATFEATHFAMLSCHKIYSAGGIVSSDQNILALNNHPQGRPAGEYYELAISGSHNGSTVVPLELGTPGVSGAGPEGEIISWTIEVTQPYIGASADCRWQLDQFGFFLMDGLTMTRQTGHYIDLKVGPRTVVITTDRITGGVASDDFTGWESGLSGWLPGRALNTIVTTNTVGASQQPAAQMRIRTNMGPPFEASSGRVRFRIR